MERAYFSTRTGLNPNAAWFPLADVIEAFVRVSDRMWLGFFFDQAFENYHDVNRRGDLHDTSTVRRVSLPGTEAPSSQLVTACWG
jgi:hypothetical protein